MKVALGQIVLVDEGSNLEKSESQTAALIIQGERLEAVGSEPFKQHSNTGGGRKQNLLKMIFMVDALYTSFHLVLTTA